MITISRQTGQIIQMDRPTPEQVQRAWEKILVEHVRLHPELLRPNDKKENA